jgi:hypothetical protein
MSAMLAQVIHLLSFLIFIALGIAVTRSKSARRRRVISLFIAYTIAVNLFSGITQIDNWPFASYTLAAFRARTHLPVCLTQFVPVDASGREYLADTYAFSPVYSSILQYWFESNYASLAPADQRTVLTFLTAKAEAARQRQMRGSPFGFERLLGPAAAPYWWLLPRSREYSTLPYTSMRVYRWCAVPDELLRNPRAASRTLVAGSPR